MSYGETKGVQAAKRKGKARGRSSRLGKAPSNDQGDWEPGQAPVPVGRVGRAPARVAARGSTTRIPGPAGANQGRAAGSRGPGGQSR
jgi:hypothetical protein